MKLKEIDANQNAAKLSDAERLEQEMKMGYSSDLMSDLNQPIIGNWNEKLTFLFCSSRMSVDVIKHQLFFDKFETNIRIKEKKPEDIPLTHSSFTSFPEKIASGEYSLCSNSRMMIKLRD